MSVEDMNLNKTIVLVRPPTLSYYHDTDVKEEPLITQFLSYLSSVGWNEEAVPVVDYHLDRSLSKETVLEFNGTDYVLIARDVGESYHYTISLALFLLDKTQSNVYVYGQISPLAYNKKLPKEIQLVTASEVNLAAAIGLPTDGKNFSSQLTSEPYFHRLPLADEKNKKMKGAIETTRGCPFPCKFCFINVGDSYEKRWQTKPNESILKEIDRYYRLGIKDFVFLDSEFLGMSPKHHQQRKLLLEHFCESYPDIKYMILNRADTLLKFDQFKLLKKSGMKKILLGVESFYQPDLDYFKKKTTTNILLEGIKQLISHQISCCLTFITFHQNTSVESLEYNLDILEKLYQDPNARYLGVPNFSFNMEIVRGDPTIANQPLSDNTYLKPSLLRRGQLKFEQSSFPSEFEVLADLYRVLQYEWVVKKCTLLRAKYYGNLTKEEADNINLWFDRLGIFCIEIMRDFLDRYKLNQLIISSKNYEYIYNKYKALNELLPEKYRHFETYSGHGEYLGEQKVAMEDHGWDHLIPYCDEYYYG